MIVAVLIKFSQLFGPRRIDRSMTGGESRRQGIVNSVIRFRLTPVIFSARWISLHRRSFLERSSVPYSPAASAARILARDTTGDGATRSRVLSNSQGRA